MDQRMDEGMDKQCFKSLVTVLQSYRDGDKIIMKH